MAEPLDPKANLAPMTMDPKHPDRVHAGRVEQRIAALEKERRPYIEGTFTWDVKTEDIVLLRELLALRAALPAEQDSRLPDFEEVEGIVKRLLDMDQVADPGMRRTAALEIIGLHAQLRRALSRPKAETGPDNVGLETDAENMLRDMQEGRFPARSEPVIIRTTLRLNTVRAAIRSLPLDELQPAFDAGALVARLGEMQRKEVYNAVAYLARRGELERLGYGHYLIKEIAPSSTSGGDLP